MTEEFVPNTTVVPGEDVYENLVTQDATLGKDGLYHTKTDGVSLRDYYLQEELEDYTPNNTKLDNLKARLAADLEYLSGDKSKSKVGLKDVIEEVKAELEERSKILDPELLREIDDEFKKLEKELASLEREKEGLIAKIISTQDTIKFIEDANKKHAEKNKETTRDFLDDEIKELKAIIEEKEKVDREIKKLEKESYDTSIIDEYGVTTDKVSIANALTDKRAEFKNLERQERELKMKLRRAGLNAFEELNPNRNGNNIDGEKVTVTFNLHGGSKEGVSYDPIEIDKGSVINAPESPSLDDDHEFEGWMLNGAPYDFSQPVNENITLEAKYKEIVRHPVTFCDEKGNELNIEQIKNGDTLGAKLRQLDDKKFKLFEGWEKEDGTLMRPDEPVTGPLKLTANYKKDWKKIAAIAGGVALGAVTVSADLLLGTGGIISNVAPVVLGLGSTAVNYALKNLKAPIDTRPLTGLKKGGAKLVNFFRNNKNLKNINTFLRTGAISTLVGGIGLRVAGALGADTDLSDNFGKNTNGNGQGGSVANNGQNGSTGNTEQVNNNDTLNNGEDNTLGVSDGQGTGNGAGTETVQENAPETVQEYFDNKGKPNSIFDNIHESSQGYNHEQPLPQFDGARPERAFNPLTGESINFDPNTTTMEDIKQALGTDNPQFDFMKNGESMGWVDEINSYGGVSR